MSLSSSTLLDAILSITDPSRPGHAFPATGEVGTRWAAAARAYFAELSAPPPTAPALDSGASAMAGILDSAAGPDEAEAAFPEAWQAFAVAFALPLTPAVALPPPSPPVFPELAPTNDPIEAATIVAGAIDAWARTGLTGTPPTPPALPWA